MNQDEKDYINLSNRYRIRDIFHDNRAIRQLANDGVYTVKISDIGSSAGFCVLDTGSIKVKAIEVARKASKFMSFKEHYKFIDVEFETIFSKQKMKDEQVLCNYVVRMPLDNLTEAKLLSGINSYIAPTRQ